jgi:hypothetical protein
MTTLYRARVGDLQVRMLEPGTSRFAIVIDDGEVFALAHQSTDFADAKARFLQAMKLAQDEAPTPAKRKRAP